MLLPQTNFNNKLLFVYTHNFKVLKSYHIPFTKADLQKGKICYLSSINKPNPLTEPRTLINIVSDYIQLILILVKLELCIALVHTLENYLDRESTLHCGRGGRRFAKLWRRCFIWQPLSYSQLRFSCRSYIPDQLPFFTAFFSSQNLYF